MKGVDYNQLHRQLEELTENVPYETANLSNAAALLWNFLPDINWAGFYKMTDGHLVLGPFQGKPACICIPVGKGVCGTAVQGKKTVLCHNVHDFPGHIACDSASNAEIVIPIFRDGQVWGVLDIDSPVFSRFTPEDQAGLEGFVRILEKCLLPIDNVGK